MNFTFERLTPENLYRLKQLLKAEYGKDVSLTYLQQKYDARHLHPGMFGYYALYNNEAVAVATAVPYLLQCNGVVELTAQSADSITFPAFRGKGLFTTLSNLLYNDLIQEGFSCIWGFPSESTEVIYRKLSWQQVSPVNGYYIPVANRYMAYARRLLNAVVYGHMASQHFFKQVLSAEKPLASFAGNEFVSVHRNNDYYRYKNFGGSFCVIVNGKRVWFKQAGSLNIGEIDPLTADEVLPLINDLKKYARRAGAPYICFQTSKGSVNNAVFEQHFEKFESWKIGYRNFNSKLPLDKLSLTWADMDTF